MNDAHGARAVARSARSPTHAHLLRPLLVCACCRGIGAAAADTVRQFHALCVGFPEERLHIQDGPLRRRIEELTNDRRAKTAQLVKVLVLPHARLRQRVSGPCYAGWKQRQYITTLHA